MSILIQTNEVLSHPFSNLCYFSVASEKLQYQILKQNRHSIALQQLFKADQMFKKPHQGKLSACKLLPTGQDLHSVPDYIEDYLVRTIKTPKHRQIRPNEFETLKTQKLSIAKKLKTDRDLLPSLKRLQPVSRENLLDLDVLFQDKIKTVCQSDRLSLKHDFVIRKVRNPSLSSNGKDTSAGSSQHSVEEKQLTAKHGSESPQISKYEDKGKSHSKYLMPSCKIVHTKKLPFQLQPHHRKYEDLNELNWNISRIAKEDQDCQLMTAESFELLRPFM